MWYRAPASATGEDARTWKAKSAASRKNLSRRRGKRRSAATMVFARLQEALGAQGALPRGKTRPTGKILLPRRARPGLRLLQRRELRRRAGRKTSAIHSVRR